MTYYTIELIKGFLETSLFGSSFLVAFFIIAIAIGILMIAKAYPEVLLLIPAPLVIVFADSGYIPAYFKPIIFILAGIYLGMIILVLLRLDK